MPSKAALMAIVVIGSILGFMVLLFILVTIFTFVVLRSIDKGLNGGGPENSLRELIKLVFRRVCPRRRRERKNKGTQTFTGEPTAIQLLQIATANQLNAVSSSTAPGGTLSTANGVSGTDNHAVRMPSPMMPLSTTEYYPQLQVIQPASSTTLPLPHPLLRVTQPLSVTRQPYHPSMYGRVRAREGMVYLPVRYGPGSVYQMETYTPEDIRRIGTNVVTPPYIGTGHEHGHRLQRTYTLDSLGDEESQLRRIQFLQGGPPPAYEASPPYPPPPGFSPSRPGTPGPITPYPPRAVAQPHFMS